jgi:hypothetical protein
VIDLPVTGSTEDSAGESLSDASDSSPWVGVNAAAATTYTAPLTFSSEGTYAVRYSALDGSGVRSAEAYDYYGIDKTRPTVFSNAKPVYDCAATITVNATDTLSGATYVYYKLDGKTDTAISVYNAPHSLEVTAGVGSHSLSFFGFDSAGNVSARQTVTFAVNPSGYVPVLSNPTVRSARKRRVTFSGNVTAAATAATVGLQVQRKVGRRWRAFTYLYVPVAQYADSYSFATRLAKTGTYRVRAYEGTGASPGWTTFRVR